MSVFADLDERRGVFVVELGLDDARDVYLARGVIERAAAAIVVKEQPEAALADLQQADTALFLRAERQAGGLRTFRLAEGEPLPTSYGQDLYERIFGGQSAAIR